LESNALAVVIQKSHAFARADEFIVDFACAQIRTTSKILFPSNFSLEINILQKYTGNNLKILTK